MFVICALPGLRAADTTMGQYVLGPGDEIAVWAQGAEEMAAHPVRIDPGGFVDLPLAGHVQAAGLTTEQLKAQISQKLAHELRNPERVAVTITDYKSQPVSVMGAVNKPGVYQMQGSKNLLEVLSLAEGPKSDAGSTVRITRQLDQDALPLLNARPTADGKASTVEISLQDVLDGNNQASNLLVRPHDIVTVSQPQTIYVMGDVKKPGGFALGARQRVSVLQALSLSEGYGPAASPGSARILRASGDGPERKQIPVNLSEITAGKTSDIYLQPDDILFVPNSKMKNVSLRAAEVAVTVASGVAIWRIGYPAPH